MKKKIDLSPNFSKSTRSTKSIKFVIIHYTGMQSLIESINRLKKISSKVSCHYLISRKGEIIQMVKENKIAWHAGKSKWKNIVNLNKYSIGIELENKGHEFGYQKFSNPQIKSLIKLCRSLQKKYKIKAKNFLGHSDIAPLRKKDPGEMFPWQKLSEHKVGIWHQAGQEQFEKNNIDMEESFFQNLFKIGYRYFQISKRDKKDQLLIKAFQRRYSPYKVNGKIDQKLLKISHFLANNKKLT